MKSLKLSKALIYSILAGAAIGLGGFLYIIGTAYVDKALGSLFFAIGLWLVCFFKFNLYTGKIGFAFENHTKIYALDLFIMLIGNTIGAYLFGLLMRLTGVLNVAVIQETIAKVAAARNILTNETFYHAFFSSFMCGTLVYSAVFFFKKLHHLVFKSFALVACVFLFVYFGFEHVIANIFYFSFANVVDWAFVLNTLICVVGNSLGAFAVNYLSKLNLKK